MQNQNNPPFPEGWPPVSQQPIQEPSFVPVMQTNQDLLFNGQFQPVHTYTTDYFTPTFNPYDSSGQMTTQTQFVDYSQTYGDGYNNSQYYYKTQQQTVEPSHNRMVQTYSQGTFQTQQNNYNQPQGGNPFEVDYFQNTSTYNNGPNYGQSGHVQQQYVTNNMQQQPQGQYTNMNPQQMQPSQMNQQMQTQQQPMQMQPNQMNQQMQTQQQPMQMQPMQPMQSQQPQQLQMQTQQSQQQITQYSQPQQQMMSQQPQRSEQRQTQNPFDIFLDTSQPSQNDRQLDLDIESKPIYKKEYSSPSSLEAPSGVRKERVRSMNPSQTREYNNVIASLKDINIKTDNIESEPVKEEKAPPRRYSTSDRSVTTNPFLKFSESQDNAPKPDLFNSSPLPESNAEVSSKPSKRTPKQSLYHYRCPWRNPTHFLSPTNKPLYVFSTPTHIVINIKERPGEVALGIEKKKGHPGTMNEVPLTTFADQKVIKRYNAYGVLGTIALQNQETNETESFLILVVGIDYVGKITDVPVYKISQVHFVSFNTVNEINYAEAKKTPYDELKRFCENGSFYFSLDYDLTHTQQRIHSKRDQLKDLQMCKAADRRFFWNRYLARYFIRKKLDDYLVMVIRGIVCIAEKQYISSNNQVDIYLISRIGCLRAGTRYNARGRPIFFLFLKKLLTLLFTRSRCKRQWRCW